MNTSNTATNSKRVRFILLVLFAALLGGCAAAGPGYSISVGGGRGYYNYGHRGYGHRYQRYCRQVPQYDYYGNYVGSYSDCR